MEDNTKNFQRKISPHQMFSWGIYIYTLLVFAIQIFPRHLIVESAIWGFLFILTLCMVIYYTIKLSLSDSSDPLVKAYNNSEDEM